MSETVISLLLTIHLGFVAIWIGAQVLVAVAVVPALRTIPTEGVRLDALEQFTRRFNRLAWLALAGIVLTGSLLAQERIDDIKTISDTIFDLRWGYLFVIKMSLVIVMAVVTALHAFGVGPRLLRLQRQMADRQLAGEDAAVRSLRAQSILLSMLGLALSLTLLAAGAFLSNTSFSWVPA